MPDIVSEYCHAPEVAFNLPFEVEHVIPVSHAGADDAANLALACRACNLFKADHLSAEDEETQREVPMFHPRQDSCSEHFAVEPAAGVIRGLTAPGRATVLRLQMNSPAQLAARKQLMFLGVFP